MRPKSKIGKDGAAKPITVPIKNKNIALHTNVLVVNRPMKQAVSGIKITSGSIKLVVNHCTCEELIANSCIIFGKAVMRRNCVKTNKKDADNVVATIKRRCKGDIFVAVIILLLFHCNLNHSLSSY